MGFEILVTLMLRDAGSMRATAEVTIQTALGALTVSGFKVIEKEPGKPWVGMPSKEYVGKDGTKKYQKLLEMPKALLRAVTEAVLAEYKKQLAPI